MRVSFFPVIFRHGLTPFVAISVVIYPALRCTTNIALTFPSKDAKLGSVLAISVLIVLHLTQSFRAYTARTRFVVIPACKESANPDILSLHRAGKLLSQVILHSL